MERFVARDPRLNAFGISNKEVTGFSMVNRSEQIIQMMEAIQVNHRKD